MFRVSVRGFPGQAGVRHRPYPFARGERAAARHSTATPRIAIPESGGRFCGEGLASGLRFPAHGERRLDSLLKFATKADIGHAELCV